MIMEMRVYRCLSRPAAALMKRDRVRLRSNCGRRHGIKQAGFFPPRWSGTSNPGTDLFVAWESRLAERE
jgi:hypothetical protein